MLPVIDTPQYTLKVPSTKKEVKFRPFLVKEEKILLTALESADDDNKAINVATDRIIQACTFGNLEVKELTEFDIEYIFLSLRAKSRGELLTPSMPCINEVDGKTCGEINEVSINIDDVEVTFPETDVSKIWLTDTVGIQFKYITSATTRFHNNEKDIVKRMFKIIVDSIDFIFDEENIYKGSETPKKELMDFVDNLTEVNFDKVKKFFDQQPVLKYEAEYKCSKCGYKEDIVFEGLDSFFV